MTFNKLISDTLSTAKSLEGQAIDRVKNGSKDPKDFHCISYYSGVINTLMFLRASTDNKATDADREKMMRGLLYLDEPSPQS